MSELTDLSGRLRETRRQFGELVEELRPELHRYCSRMVGSAADGEDVLQDALAQAYYALASMDSEVRLRPWLFRIAHNKAIDYLRRYDRKHGESLRPRHERGKADEDAVVREETSRLALSAFVDALPPRERACVILKDVLDHRLAEIAETLSMTVQAVKSALHRGRKKLQELDPDSLVPRQLAPEVRNVARRYIELFNARDWDGVRALLAEDVRLDLVSYARRQGKDAVGTYFNNYERISGWQLDLALVDGEETVVLFEHHGDEWEPRSLIRLRFDHGRVEEIRDYRVVPYLLADSSVEGATVTGDR